MKNRRLYLYVLLFFSTIFSGCEKTEHYYLPQEIKDWGYFKEGSCWIYQNVATGVLDSIYVTSTREYLDSVDADKRITRISEAIDIKYESSLNTVYNVSIYAYKTNSIIIDQNDKHNNIISHYIPLRINPNNEISRNSSSYEIIEELDTYIVEGITYTNVLHIITQVENQYFTPQFSLDHSTHEYWISKHNWIVKKMINNSRINEDWKLIRSNIIQ
jgi:hypothetical protein